MSAEPTPMSAHSSPTKKCRVDSACVPTTPPSLTKSSRENESPANAAPGENSPGATTGDDPAEKEPRISDGSSDDNARVSESSGGDEPLDVAAVAEEANHTQVAEEEEDESIKLARMLQEQERAYYMLQHSNQNTPGTHPEDVSQQHEDMQYRFDVAEDDSTFAPPEGDAETDAADAAQTTPPETLPAPSGGEEEDESIRLARELMAEEQRVFQARMLEWAGVQMDPETGAIDDEDDGVDVEAMTYEELTALGEQIGTQSKGLCVEVIDALPVRRYVSTRGGDDGEEEEKCMICIMHFEEGDDVRRVPKCGHEYHPECLTPWLSENKCCPICKTEIDAKEVLSGAEGITA